MNTDIDDLLSGWREEVTRSYHLPRWAPRLVAKKLGLTAVTMRSWQDRGILELDAGRDRDRGSHRLYSNHDAIVLSAAHTLNTLGVSVPEIADLVAMIGKHVGDQFGRIMNSAHWPSNVIHIHHDGKKHVATREPPESVAYITLDLDKLVDRTFGALGVRVTRGTAEDFRRAAEEMEKAEKAAQAPKRRRAK